MGCRMRSLELAGLSGFGIVAVFSVIVCWTACAAGLPAIKSGELPLFGLQASSTLSCGKPSCLSPRADMGSVHQCRSMMTSRKLWGSLALASTSCPW